MHDLLRKHRKVILVVLMVLIIGPFVLWGGYRRSGRDRGGREGPTIVASVGAVAITAAEYQQRLYSEASQRGMRTGQPVSFEDMAADGTAERVLEGLINQALFNLELRKSDFRFERDFLVEILKKGRTFQDENGNFDSTTWNAWIEADEKRNWSAIYAEITDQLARQMLLAGIMAPARVLDSEIRKQFEDNHTAIKLKYVAIDPEIVPNDEQIQAQYDEDPTKYQVPEKRTAEFVAVSLAPPRPPIVDELVRRARGGEDFAELAKQHSDAPNKDSGGDLGWVDESPNSPEFLKALFEIPVGEVGDPAEWGGAYYIYKVEEERTDEDTGLRGVKARQILIRPRLGDEERAALAEKAEGIAVKAAETDDLGAAAAEAGIAVQTAPSFDEKSITIENVAPQDVYKFRTELSKLGKDEISTVVEARQCLYVAKIVEVAPPVIQPLEDVRDDVAKDAIETIRRSPERAEEVSELAEEIESKADSLEEIVSQFSELELGIKETKDFTRRDFFFDPDCHLQAVEAYDAVGRKEPGAFAGPLRGFRNDAYFIELVSKTPPTEENWEEDWPKEEEQLRDNALQAKRNQLVTDYLADLQERVSSEVPIQRNYTEVANILGTGREEPPEEPAPEDQSSAGAAEEKAEPEVEGETPPDEDASGEEAPAAESPDQTPTPDEPAAEQGSEPKAEDEAPPAEGTAPPEASSDEDASG